MCYLTGEIKIFITAFHRPTVCPVNWTALFTATKCKLYQSELVGDVAVPVSVRQVVLFCALRSPHARPRLNWRRSSSTVLSQVCLRRPGRRLQFLGAGDMQACRAQEWSWDLSARTTWPNNFRFLVRTVICSYWWVQVNYMRSLIILFCVPCTLYAIRSASLWWAQSELHIRDTTTYLHQIETYFNFFYVAVVFRRQRLHFVVEFFLWLQQPRLCLQCCRTGKMRDKPFCCIFYATTSDVQNTPKKYFENTK